MKTSYVFITVFILSIAFTVCGSSPNTDVNPSATVSTVDSVSVPDELDTAIREASDYLNGRIQPDSKVVFLNIQSSFPDLSEYIISILSENAVNDDIFSVVDRQQLDIIRAELNFQLSGEVSDESAQSIGQMLGAQTIVSGTVTKIGALYRLQIKAIAVQTATIQGQWSRNIPSGMTIATLTGNQSSGATPNSTSGSTAISSSVSAADTPVRTTSTTSVPVPTGLVAEAISSSEIQLEWNPVEGAMSYKVYRSSASGGTYTHIGSSDSTTYTDSNLHQNTAYYYRVSAVINDIESRQATTATARTPIEAITPPGNTLAQQLAWIDSQGGNGTVYDIIVSNDILMRPTTVSTRGRNITINIRSANPLSPRIRAYGAGASFRSGHKHHANTARYCSERT